ncbi:MAG: hypothetical protein P9L94_18885 [Candidatus Hinthialibacter antarcticus]|nr:hypothetical protein [Candidatus Hinthialibacter antarcticus]
MKQGYSLLCFLFCICLLVISLWIDRYTIQVSKIGSNEVEIFTINEAKISYFAAHENTPTIKLESFKYVPNENKIMISNLCIEYEQPSFEKIPYYCREIMTIGSGLTRSQATLHSNSVDFQENRAATELEITGVEFMSKKIFVTIQNLKIHNGDFLFFKTALYKKISGSGVNLRLIGGHEIQQITSKSMNWNYPIQNLVFKNGSILYSDGGVKKFSSCLFDIAALEIKNKISDAKGDVSSPRSMPMWMQMLPDRLLPFEQRPMKSAEKESRLGMAFMDKQRKSGGK